jgi:hypothetical protein
VKVYFREDSDVYYGDLTSFGDTEIPKVLFRATNKSLTLNYPVVSIGNNHIHVIAFGVDYLFYVEKPDWVDVDYKVAKWCLDNENGV